jgi:hypothetical protein
MESCTCPLFQLVVPNRVHAERVAWVLDLMPRPCWETGCLLRLKELG